MLFMLRVCMSLCHFSVDCLCARARVRAVFQAHALQSEMKNLIRRFRKTSLQLDMVIRFMAKKGHTFSLGMIKAFEGFYFDFMPFLCKRVRERVCDLCSDNENEC